MTMTSRAPRLLLTAVVCYAAVVTKVCGVAVDNGDVTDDVIVGARCRARCLSRLQDRLTTDDDRSRRISSSLSLSERCQRDTACLSCAMPCDVTAQHCDVICSSTPHVDEGCRQSCEFLREVADWLADTRTQVCPDNDAPLTSRLCTSHCSADSECLLDEMCCSTDHCGRSCVRPVRPLTTVCSQELAAVAARELVDLDAVQLTWSCLDDEDSQPTIYLVQSSSTTGQHHPTRRRLRAADADVDSAAWRIVAETSSCSAVIDGLRPTRKYYFRLFAVNSSACRGLSTASRPFVLSREPRKPYAPLNLTVGETLVADGRVSVTIHWLPPLESDLPVTRYKIFWSQKLSLSASQVESVHEFRHVLPARHLSYRIDDLRLDNTYLVQIQSICQHDEMRLKSEKARMFITTPSSSASVDNDEYVYDSSSEARLLPSSATTITASVHADDPYFQNGLVRANVTWQIAGDQKDDDDDGSGVYRLQWFPESCSNGRSSLGEAPLVAMSATTQDRHFIIYDLHFDCVYVVRLQDGADRVSGHVLVTTPSCDHVTVVGDVTPDCPPKVDRPPTAPLYLRYSFIITSVNITVQLSWQPPTSGDVTGYRVTCSRAGSNWYTDRRTLVTTTLPSNASSYSVRQLREASNYVIRVAATSAAGTGRHASARFTTPRLQPAHTVTDGMRPHQRDNDEADAKSSDFNGQESTDVEGNNHTEDTKNTMQHSSDVRDTAEDHSSRDSDAYGPTDWAGVEVKKLGRQKPHEQNEVHSYHIDLSAYYASSQTLSTSNVFVITTTALLPICCFAH